MTDRGLLVDAFSQSDLTVIDGSVEPVALTPMAFDQGQLVTQVLRPVGAADRRLTIDLMGTDPNGILQTLSVQTIDAVGPLQDVSFELPTELRNRVQQVRLRDVRSAGALAVTDDSVQSRKVALLSGSQDQEAGTLLSNLHYVRTALTKSATLIETDLGTALVATPDILIFADVGRLSDVEEVQVLDWIEEGGTLVRFAGPRLIGSGIGQREEDPLLPVRLCLFVCGRVVVMWVAPCHGASLKPVRTCPCQFGRWHALGHRQGARRGSGDPVSCHGECAMVEFAALWSVRENAGTVVDFHTTSICQGRRFGGFGLDAIANN